MILDPFDLRKKKIGDLFIWHPVVGGFALDSGDRSTDILGLEGRPLVVRSLFIITFLQPMLLNCVRSHAGLYCLRSF